MKILLPINNILGIINLDCCQISFRYFALIKNCLYWRPYINVNEIPNSHVLT